MVTSLAVYAEAIYERAEHKFKTDAEKRKWLEGFKDWSPKGMRTRYEEAGMRVAEDFNKSKILQQELESTEDTDLTNLRRISTEAENYMYADEVKRQADRRIKIQAEIEAREETEFLEMEEAEREAEEARQAAEARAQAQRLAKEAAEKEKERAQKRIERQKAELEREGARIEEIERERREALKEELAQAPTAEEYKETRKELRAEPGGKRVTGQIRRGERRRALGTFQPGAVLG